MNRAPDDAEMIDDSYSNFDHVMPKGAEQALLDGKVVSHPAWNHHGTIWYSDGQFHEEVWQYGCHVSTLSADSLKDVFDLVNEEFGSE